MINIMKVEDRDFIQDINFLVLLSIFRKNFFLWFIQWPDSLSCKKTSYYFGKLAFVYSYFKLSWLSLSKANDDPIKSSDKTNLSNI